VQAGALLQRRDLPFQLGRDEQVPVRPVICDESSAAGDDPGDDHGRGARRGRPIDRACGAVVAQLYFAVRVCLCTHDLRPSVGQISATRPQP
jgi:hypothetical protein